MNDEKRTDISPTIEPMLTITPLLRSAISGTTALTMRRMANALVSNIFVISSTDWSMIGPGIKSYRNWTGLICEMYHTCTKEACIVYDHIDFPLNSCNVLDDSPNGVITGHIEGKFCYAGILEIPDGFQVARGGVNFTPLLGKRLTAGYSW